MNTGSQLQAAQKQIVLPVAFLLRESLCPSPQRHVSGFARLAAITIAGAIPLPSPRTSSSSSSSAAAAAAAASCSLCCCNSLRRRYRTDIGPHAHGCMQPMRVMLPMHDRPHAGFHYQRAPLWPHLSLTACLFRRASSSSSATGTCMRPLSGAVGFASSSPSSPP